MAGKPLYALRVRHLDGSVTFYRDVLGFSLRSTDPAAGVAVMEPPAGPLLLLARPGAGDVSPWMNDVFEEIAGERPLHLGAPGDDLEAYHRRLADRGLKLDPPRVAGDGGRTLAVRDPDGNLLLFWESPRWTDEELLAVYGSAAARLRQALAGLADPHLDLARAPGKWTIRQIVHHVADSDAASLPRILMSLAEPGRSYLNNPYDQDVWVERLDHAHRPVETSLRLIEAVRDHVTALIRHLPHGLDHAVQPSLGAPLTVRELVRMLASHALGHIAQIVETRRVHGL